MASEAAGALASNDTQSTWTETPAQGAESGQPLGCDRWAYLQQVEVESAAGHAHRCDFATSCRSREDDGAARKDPAPQTPALTQRHHCSGAAHLPVLQVWSHDAAEEVDRWLKTWKRQRGPRRALVPGAVGDRAGAGRPLHTHMLCPGEENKRSLSSTTSEPSPGTGTSSVCPPGKLRPPPPLPAHVNTRRVL